MANHRWGQPECRDTETLDVNVLLVIRRGGLNTEDWRTELGGSTVACVYSVYLILDFKMHWICWVMLHYPPIIQIWDVKLITFYFTVNTDWCMHGRSKNTNTTSPENEKSIHIKIKTGNKSWQSTKLQQWVYPNSTGSRNSIHRIIADSGTWMFLAWPKAPKHIWYSLSYEQQLNMYKKCWGQQACERDAIRVRSSIQVSWTHTQQKCTDIESLKVKNMHQCVA